MNYLLGMDLISFRALRDGSNRVAAANKVENAWTNMLSAQGDSKAMKKWLDPFVELLKTPTSAAKDAASFLKKYGKGI